MAGTPIDFVTDAPTTGSLEVQWIHGSDSASTRTDPPIQVHAYDPHTFVLRQSKSVHFEAPFIYLLCGNDRAVLMDTGATSDPAAFPLRTTVDGILDRWLAENPRDSYELVVAHTHGHSDHIRGDAQFADRPGTTVVGVDLPDVQSFFAFSAWPREIVRFDLGGRVLELTGCPGHQEASIAVHDPWSGFLLTGDTVYPGRLYVCDFPAFTASLDSLIELAQSRAVTHVMGSHIEMSRTPGRDYPMGATHQPDEPPLQITPDQLQAVRDAAASVANQPGSHAFDDFAIVHAKASAS